MDSEFDAEEAPTEFNAAWRLNAPGTSMPSRGDHITKAANL
jgi:hypothetical protein